MSTQVPEFNISVGQSERYMRTWIYGDANKKPIPITGYKFWMSIVDDPEKENQKPLIYMTSENASGDRIDISQAAEGKWKEIFDPAPLCLGKTYYYDLLMEDTAGLRRVIRKGTVTLTRNLTRVEDE